MLRWSVRARADLKAIHDYIAKDSPLNAKAVARERSSRIIGLLRSGLDPAELARQRKLF